MIFSRFDRYYSHIVKKDAVSSFMQKSVSLKGHASIEIYSQDKKQLGLSYFVIELLSGTKPTVFYT